MKRLMKRSGTIFLLLGILFSCNKNDDDSTLLQTTMLAYAAHQIQVTVSGLIDPGLILQNNGGDDLPIDADGSYSFGSFYPMGSSYSISVSSHPMVQYCAVINGEGTIGTAFASEVTVNCLNATVLVSNTILGTGGDSYSHNPSISGDGRYVAFSSPATNLVPDDTNGTEDIFVKDMKTGEIVRVSVTSDGSEATGGDSTYPSISRNGRYVVFQSNATNLVPGDTNWYTDIFLHDLQTGATTRVSVDSSGNQVLGGGTKASITPDGRYVVFASGASTLVTGDTNGFVDIFVKDLQTGAVTRASITDSGAEGNNHSDQSAISADGRYVAFLSTATNMIGSGDTNGKYDIFVRDLQAGTTVRVSKASDGTEGNDHSTTPSISDDGRYVAFSSDASNLVSGDTNSGRDIFRHDLQTGATIRLSVSSDGAQADVSLAAFTFNSSPRISPDGRIVAFSSDATNLVADDFNGTKDVFLHDTVTGETRRISLTEEGKESIGTADNVSLNSNGSYLFGSFNSNGVLTSDDKSPQADVFAIRL